MITRRNFFRCRWAPASSAVTAFPANMAECHYATISEERAFSSVTVAQREVASPDIGSSAQSSKRREDSANATTVTLD